MTLPASSRFRFTADLNICRILNGMWQVSGAHGAIDPARAIEEMFTYHDAGFTSWHTNVGPFRRGDLEFSAPSILPGRHYTSAPATTIQIPPQQPATRL